MYVGVLAWNLSIEKYYDCTIKCLKSLIDPQNEIILIAQETNDTICDTVNQEIHGIKVINNLPWKNNVSLSWNYLLDTFFSRGSCAAIISNDVVVSDRKFNWVNDKEIPPKGIIHARDQKGDPEQPFAAFVIYKWLWDKVGKFDQNVPHLANDTDYIYRLDEAGIHAYFDGRFRIEHEKKVTINGMINSKNETFIEECNAADKYLRNKWPSKYDKSWEETRGYPWK